MKIIKILFVLTTILLLASQAKAQGIYIHDIALSTANTSAGTVVRPIAGATITVCQGTVSGAPCGPLANVYTNGSINVLASSSTVLSDSTGNYGFWIDPNQYLGQYTVSITGTGVTGYSYNISVGCLKNTTCTWTGKTFDTAGAGNVLKINGTTLIDKTGTGKVVLDTSPTIATPIVSSPTTTGTDAGAETLNAKTLGSPIINGTPTGTGIDTTFFLAGTGAGNYTTANLTAANILDVDTTNLKKTLTVPTGWKLDITASFTAFNTVGGADETFVGIVEDGTTVKVGMQTQSANAGANSTLDFTFTGDGASHSWQLQYVGFTGGTSTIVNGTIGGLSTAPTMKLHMYPSN